MAHAATILPPASKDKDLFAASISGIFSTHVAEAPATEVRDIEKETVRCPPRPLWTVPPATDERIEWMRAMARGESLIPTVRPSSK